MTASASAPASSANLGPGFDFLALALELRCTVTAEPADTWSVPREAEAIATEVAAALGIDQPLRMSIDSEIAVGRGLGSSAALAVAAGAAALRATGRDIDREAVFRAAAASDGHPDNAAAAVYGGLVAVAGTRVRPLSISEKLIPVLAVPNRMLPTAEARAALPKTLPHAAAARSAARAAFLVEGLRTGDATALAAAKGDELHEQPRAALSPLSRRLIDSATDAGALYAAWSGAGPSVLALAETHTAAEVQAALAAELGGEGVAMRLEVATEGVR